MSKPRLKLPLYGVPDEDNPEWTAADFRRARPVKEVFPELLEAVKHARGRPKLAQTKQHVSLRLDPQVIAGFKAMGPGWQRRINDVLARALARSAAGAKAAKLRKPARRRAA